MRQRLHFIFAWVIVALSGTVAAQPLPTPTAPEQLIFADINVRFDSDARKIVQQDINALMGNRQYWNAKLDRALLYFPIIESILLSEEIPTDFKYLAMQESSLNPDAVSTSQAVGFWQFKRETATDYGMQVNDEVDERKNVTSSTHAAARYLRRSNGMYNNWVSALFSFYLGTGGISQLVSPDWAYAKDITLTSRTDRYILRFFAHKLAAEHAFKTYKTANTFALIEYPNAGGKTVDALAAELNISPADIRTYNRWLLVDHVPTAGNYVLTIPTPNGQINDLRERIATTSKQPLKNTTLDDIGFPVLKKIASANRSSDDAILYEINGLPGIQAQAGDNSGTLARKAKISLSSFLRFNELTERDLLVPGDVYYLAKKHKKALVPFHTARPDETMRSISQRYGIRLKKLLRYNRMDRVQKLQVGRVLWLREKRPSKTPVEVINGPTPPVYDPSPTPPSDRPVADRPTGSDRIPRNTAERKRYQPKLVGEANPSAAPAPSPETRPSTSAGGMARSGGTSKTASPTPTVTVPTAQPATTPPMVAEVPSNTTPDVPAPRQDVGSPQRTIIIRSEGEPSRERTTPARQDVERTTERTTEPIATTPPKRRETRPVDVSAPAPAASMSSGNVPDEPVTRPRPSVFPETPDPTLPRSSSPDRTAQTKARQPGTSPADRDATGNRNQSATLPPLPPMTKPRIEEPATGGASRTMTHTVEAGQTYFSISRYYGVSVENLLLDNGLSPDNKLAVGQKLTVRNVQPGYPTGQPVSAPAAPRSEATAPATQPEPTAPVAAPVAAGPTYHTVAKGETLYSISRQYGVTVERLKEWNKLPDLNARLGQKLKVSE